MKIPSIRILSREINLLGQLDAYSSLLFKRSWQGVGEFQIVASSVAAGADKLQIGRLIMLDGDGRRAGIIEDISAVEGANGVYTYTVTGTTLNGLAQRRITLPDNDAYNGGYDNVPPLTAGVPSPSPVAAETILKAYASRHMISPTDLTRKISGLVLAPDLRRGKETVWMSRLEQLDEVLQAVCEYTDTGYEIHIDLAAKQLVFDILPGIDRTYSQNENSRIIFSSGYDNITGVAYKHGLSALKNLGYAGGAGENQNRVIFKVTHEATEPTGWDRREVFLDCGSLGLVETATTMSLQEEGLHQLKDYREEETLTATVAEGGSFQYLKQWDLGDKVTVVSKKLGVMFDTHITEVTERYESRQLGIDITLGTPKPDIGRVIRKLQNIAR